MYYAFPCHALLYHFFHYVKKHKIIFTILTILNVQFSSVVYSHC